MSTYVRYYNLKILVTRLNIFFKKNIENKDNVFIIKFDNTSIQTLNVITVLHAKFESLKKNFPHHTFVRRRQHKVRL